MPGRWPGEYRKVAFLVMCVLTRHTVSNRLQTSVHITHELLQMPAWNDSVSNRLQTRVDVVSLGHLMLTTDHTHSAYFIVVRTYDHTSIVIDTTPFETVCKREWPAPHSRPTLQRGVSRFETVCKREWLGVAGIAHTSASLRFQTV